MKRDWDLIRKQLIDIEEENELFSDIPTEPIRLEQPYPEYVAERRAYDDEVSRIYGHVELLVDSGYVDGLKLLRTADGKFSIGLNSPRLTMAGHDLLDTMRSSKVWDKVKETATSKGIELTFDSIKMLATNITSMLLAS